jgi:hypothetical protein
MDTEESDLAAQFREISDEELIARCNSGGLTELAQNVALRELTARGLEYSPKVEPTGSDDEPYEGDFVIAARFLNPIDAQVVCDCLRAAGVPAFVADGNTVQTNTLWAIALGGARVCVPALRVGEAKDIIAAFNRGEFELPPDYGQ